MKRFLAIVLLVTASVQASDLDNFWMNLGGKNSRIASGCKAVVEVIGSAAALKAVMHHAPKAFDSLQALIDNRGGWDRTYKLADHSVIAGSTLYALYVLGYHYAPTHIKHAAKIS